MFEYYISPEALTHIEGYLHKCHTANGGQQSAMVEWCEYKCDLALDAALDDNIVGGDDMALDFKCQNLALFENVATIIRDGYNNN